MKRKPILLFLLMLCAAFALKAQDEKEVRFALSVKPLYTKVFIHSESIDTFRGTYGIGAQIDLNRYRKDQRAFEYAGVHYNSGFGMQVVKFSNANLGSALNLSYFMEPFLFERPGFNLRMRCAGGLNLATMPYNEVSNPSNRAYSSHVNGYLGLGFSAWYRTGPKTHLFLDATYSHFSNGNTKNPNAGVNYPNIGLGIEHDLKTSKKPVGKLLFYPERWRFDGVLFLCNKSLPFYPKERFWAYGAMLQASYRSGNIHGWTMGLEGYTDQSMRVGMDSSAIYGPMHLSNQLLGLLGGHEFLFNRCIFSQQLGVYLFKEVPGELINRVYHRWGFNYKLSRRWMLGINLNANLQKAFILDGRLIFSLYK